MNHFDISEFLCPCCNQGEGNMSPRFLTMLDAARELASVPFRISSGFRCKARNAMTGGKSNSSHLSGNAADIHVDLSFDRYAIVNALVLAGFTRIGIGSNFIHVDNDHRKDQFIMWTY